MSGTGVGSHWWIVVAHTTMEDRAQKEEVLYHRKHDFSDVLF